MVACVNLRINVPNDHSNVRMLICAAPESFVRYIINIFIMVSRLSISHFLIHVGLYREEVAFVVLEGGVDF